MNRRVLIWLRNDLRLHDHQPLANALSANPDRALLVYCLDPRHFTRTFQFDFPKTGPIRAQFLFEALQDLRSRLRAIGNDLIILRGMPEEVLPQFVREYSVDAIYFHKEATSEELSVEKKLLKNLHHQNNKIKIFSYWGSTLFSPDKLPFKLCDLPAVFTRFREACEAAIEFESPVASPDKLPPLPFGISSGDLPTLSEMSLQEVKHDERGVLAFCGGESAALSRLRHYFWEADRLQIYKETRNGLLGPDYSSKFSPWLALGCISPRFIAEEVARYEQERVSNQSTYWLKFELMWRDYFRFFAVHVGDDLFCLGGPKGFKKEWKIDFTTLGAWINGQTGHSFVDANMRELLLTGFMSNRGRQNVASFLINDLGFDWRAGAEWFESQLIDYDVCSNWGNWAYLAGVGNDPRPSRYFDVSKQAERYDPDGRYVATWL